MPGNGTIIANLANRVFELTGKTETFHVVETPSIETRLTNKGISMTVQAEERNQGNVLAVKATGQLDKQDYEQFGPKVEQMIEQQGKIRVLLQTHDFHGWDASALWEDIKFNAKHCNDIERLAIVGEKKWERGMASFCQPFTTAKVRFFEPTEATEAQRWIESWS